MSWWEWLDWKFYHWRQRRPCRGGVHDITGPHLCADGNYRFTCSRCSYRFRSDLIRRA